MKILLVKSISRYFPYGLLYLAALLEKYNIDVSILDYVIGEYNPQKFKSELKKINPRVVGINCFSYDIKPAFDIAKMTKEVLPYAHVVMGGPHPTGLPEHVLRSEYVDSAVMGEGEETLRELIYALENNRELKGIKGLAYKDCGRVIVNSRREFIRNVDDIPFPAYHLIDLEPYFKLSFSPHGMATKHPRFVPIITSRGCPYGCIYCNNVYGKIFRARSPENVLAEMEVLYNKYGIREFHIEDDSFNIDLGRAEKILDLIVEKNLKISIQLSSGLRADGVTERLAQKMKKAGVFMVAIGVETASMDTMRGIKKGLDLAKVPEAVRLLTKYGMLVWGYFMLGFLNETYDEMKKTFDFASKLPIHFASFSIVIPYPGTELFNMVKGGIDLDAYFRTTLNSCSPQIQLSEVPFEDMWRVKKKALRRFYTPIRFLRIAKTIRSVREIKFYWKKFKQVIIRPHF